MYDVISGDNCIIKDEAIFNILLLSNNSHEKTKTNNGGILSIVCVAIELHFCLNTVNHINEPHCCTGYLLDPAGVNSAPPPQLKIVPNKCTI